MAIGDGSGWDETTPTDATTAIQIDDYNRDLRVGVSARMRHEHEWPDSQSATSEGGKHKWVTFQANAAKPTLAGTQVAAIYIKTDDNLYFEKSAGGEVTIVSGTAVGDGKALMSATDTSAGYLIDKIDGVSLVASGTDIQSGIIVKTAYDSDWFAASPTTIYTLTHDLTSVKLFSKVYWASDATGGDMEEVNNVMSGAADQGSYVADISDATCKLRVGSTLSGYIDGTGAYGNRSTGFLRVIIVAMV